MLRDFRQEDLLERATFFYGDSVIYICSTNELDLLFIAIGYKIFSANSAMDSGTTDIFF